jgi:hypothetical protein
MKVDRQRIEACLAQVAAYRASGQRADVWGPANGVSRRELASWAAHSKRWQAQLDGVAADANRSSGFVAARVAPVAGSTTIRVELTAGAVRLELHWPVAQTRELAAWVRELGR